ncbi:hypothetical protein FACS1894216_11480 [Synergistales bacterium]|nr:hypothetical protein FACS1894216_11480 [Synergistales bacterium]
MMIVGCQIRGEPNVLANRGAGGGDEPRAREMFGFALYIPGIEV